MSSRARIIWKLHFDPVFYFKVLFREKTYHKNLLLVYCISVKMLSRFHTSECCIKEDCSIWCVQGRSCRSIVSCGAHPVREARLSLSRIWVEKVLGPLKINYRQREFELKVPWEKIVYNWFISPHTPDTNTCKSQSSRPACFSWWDHFSINRKTCQLKENCIT